MRKFALFFFVVLVVAASFAEDASGTPPVAPEFSWSKEITLHPGETVDLVEQSQAGFTDAWCEISGQARVNGMETTYVSWCANSTVKVTAITECTLKIYGK